VAKGRKYKCPVCGIYDHEDSMVVEKIGGQNKRIHKVDCYRKYEREKEFKKKEREELDELVEVIKETHDIGIIPSSFYSYLQDIRNGNELFGKIGKKKSKDGYSYKVIAKTYKYCQDSIDWAIKNKTFKNTSNLLKYTRAIIINNLEDAEMSMEKHEEWEVFNNSGVEDAFDVPEFNDNKNDKKETKDDELDISDFV